jgi:oxalate---CoA ligase
VKQINIPNHNSTIARLLQVTIDPDNPALLAPNRSPLTYRGLIAQLEQVKIILRCQGIQSHDRVAVVLPNGPEMATIFLAVASIAVCAPLNPNYRQAEFEFYLADLNAKAVIIQPGQGDAARAVAITRGIAIIELIPNLDKAAGIFDLVGNYSAIGVPERAVCPDDIALVLHTSGTTARPKIVPLTQRNLCSSAQHIQATLQLASGDRCLNVMPLFHIHGLIGCLLSSLSAGASVVCTPGCDPAHFFEWLKEFQPTWYSAVPTMHQSILSQVAANLPLLTPLRLIRSSSASLPPQVMAEIEHTFQVPVIEAYGMTEASHQMTSNPLPPQVRKAGAVGIPAGPEVRIMDEQGNLLTTNRVGEVVIRGANVTLGYENNPSANQSAFTPEQKKGESPKNLVDIQAPSFQVGTNPKSKIQNPKSTDWFRTGDLGYFDADGYLFLKGRIKEIINRGGEKISPREVDEILLAHSAIKQVVTFAVPHTLLGEDVAAAVVLKENASVTEQELKIFAAQKLADFKVPRAIVFVKEIPTGATGKLQRIGLAEKLGLTATNPDLPRADYLAPCTPTEEKLVEIWADVLRIHPIGIQDNFFQLGGESISAAQIANRIRSIYRVDLPFTIFFGRATPAEMAIDITRLQAEQIDDETLATMLSELELLSDEEIN